MVKILPGKSDGGWWVVPDYLCRLISGEPTSMEPLKCKAIHRLKLDEIDFEKLTVYQQVGLREYQKQYGNQPFYRV